MGVAAMIVRQHRGGLTESMETAETIEPTLEAVSAWAELVLRMKCPAHKISVGVGVYDANALLLAPAEPARRWRTRHVQ